MIGFFIFVHALTCVFLIFIILMQSGRGGGLTESFASAESIFGAKTNEFMVRATIIMTVIFVATSLSLAYLSARREQSLMTQASAVESTEVMTNSQAPVPEPANP